MESDAPSSTIDNTDETSKSSEVISREQVQTLSMVYNTAKGVKFQKILIVVYTTG